MKTEQEIKQKIQDRRIDMLRCEDERWYDLMDEYEKEILTLQWVLGESNG